MTQNIYKIIFTFLIFASSLLAVPKLTAILVIADEYEDADMNNIAESVRRDMGTMGGLLNVLEKRNLYQVNKIVLKGKNATTQKVQSAISSVSLSSDDIFIVYFSGHGGMDSRGTFIVTSESNFLYRNELENQIKNKTARFKILITDACSNDIEGIAAARSFKTSRSSLEGKYDEIYKTLFSGYSGFLSLSASSEGEYAWSDDNYGGYFTYYFVKEGLTKGPSDNWNDIFTTSRQKVVQMFNRMPADQRNELRQEGINSQTPKAYSLPVGKNGIVPPPPPPVKDPSYDPPPTKPDPSKPIGQAEYASISIKNNTQSAVNYYVEVYSSDGETLLDEDEGTISGGNKLNFSYVSVIYFDNGTEEIGYEIGSGNYTFKATKWGAVDLFPDNDVEEYDDYEPYSASELSAVLIGVWEYELPDESVYFEFYDDGTYEIFDYDDYLIDSGDWDLFEESIDGEIYYTLSLITEDGYEDEYDFYTEDGYMIELLCLSSDSDEVSFLYATE